MFQDTRVEVEDNLGGLVLASYDGGPRDRDQLSRLGSWHLHMLSHLTSSGLHFKYQCT